MDGTLNPKRLQEGKGGVHSSLFPVVPSTTCTVVASPTPNPGTSIPHRATSHDVPTRSLQPLQPMGLGKVPLGSPPQRRQVRVWQRAQEKHRSFGGVHAGPRGGPPAPEVVLPLRLSRRGAHAGAAAGWRGERSPCRTRCTCRASRPCAPSRARPGRPGP